MLGDTRPSTALKHYIQPVPASQREAVEQLDRLLNTIEHEPKEGPTVIQ